MVKINLCLFNKVVLFFMLPVITYILLVFLKHFGRVPMMSNVFVMDGSRL